MTPKAARHLSRLAVRSERTSVMSMSMPSVTCGAPVQWALNRSAVTRRIPVRGTTSCGGSPEALLCALASSAGAAPRVDSASDVFLRDSAAGSGSFQPVRVHAVTFREASGDRGDPLLVGYRPRRRDRLVDLLGE